MKDKTLQILILILIIFGCTNSDKKIEGFVINEGEFDNCMEKMANQNSVYYQDTIQNFKIKLPSEWWLEKSELGNSYGITTVDSSLNKNESRLIAVTVIPVIKSTLKEYFSSEIRIMTKDPTMQIQKIGKLKIDALNSYWISYTKNDTLKANGILNYLNDNNSDRIFIIHSVVFGENEVDKRLCQLQNLVMTLKINDE